MVTRLPRDMNGVPIEAFRPVAGGAQSFNTGATSNGVSTLLSNNTAIIGIYCTEDAFFQTGRDGDGTDSFTTVATSSSHFLPADTYRIVSLGYTSITGTDTHNNVAAVANTIGGTFYVSELE